MPEVPDTGPEPVVTALRYYAHAGQTIAARTGTTNDTITTLIPDHQGTTHHQVSNATGALRTTWQDPYGGKRGTPPADWVGDRSYVGGTNDATGLIRIGARDYDPGLQRFITVDPVQNLADPLQWNPYLYANNTPVAKSDPTGLEPRMIDGKWHDGFGCGGVCNGSGSSTNTGNGGEKEAAGGNNNNHNPGGIKPPVQDPQREFWGFVASVAVATVASVAVGALCVSTAGIGCLIVAGMYGGFAGYAAQSVVTGHYDSGEALTSVVLGGAFSLLGPAVGAVLQKVGGAIETAAMNATGYTMIGATERASAAAARAGASAAAGGSSAAGQSADLLLSAAASGAAKSLPMNMQTVCETACKYGIDISDVTITINKSRAGYAGSTGRNGASTLTRSAFANEEQLARTLYHERFHVDQIRSGMGYPASREAAGPWEDAAVAAENDWWGQR